jgi:hypothetical protein
VLRWLVVVLLVVNGLFFAWTRGWLDGVVGVPADGGREPERLARQFQPDRIRIVTPTGTPVPAPVPRPAPALACLESGPYTLAEMVAAQAALSSLVPAERWTIRPIERPGTWLLYVGRYANREVLQKRLADFRQNGIAAEEVRNLPELEPGLSLGRFDSRARADAARQQFLQRGVRTARVVAVAPAITAQLLRVEQADPALADQLRALENAALPRGFVPCAPS